MEFGTMLGDIVILLGAASLLGMLCERVGFSAIIGALLAGGIESDQDTRGRRC